MNSAQSVIAVALMVGLVGCQQVERLTSDAKVTHGTLEVMDPEWADLVAQYPKLSAFRHWMNHNGDLCGVVYPADGHYHAYAVQDPEVKGQAKDFATERDARMYVEQYCKP